MRDITEEMRKIFEEVSAPAFVTRINLYSFNKNKNDEYIDPVLEDHWQTFQEGWEAAMKHNKSIIFYNTKTIVSNCTYDTMGNVYRNKHE